MTALALPSPSGWVVRGAAAGVAAALLGSLLLLLLLVAAIGGSRGDASSTGDLRDGSVPAELAPVFVAAAATCGLPPALLAAQARQESNFRATAVSTAGAVGLMQFMPGTWVAVGVDGSGDGTADPRNAQDAIYSGARYDCQLRDQLSDAGMAGRDLDRLMLAAYNAGPAVVLQCRCVPAYEETRTYVTNVLAFAAEMTAPAPAAGVPGEPGKLVYPLAAQAEHSSSYGWRRHPISGLSKFHAGEDMAAPAGTPVLAATAGRVSVAGWSNGYGNYVCVERDAHFKTCYGHLAAINVQLGQLVGAGAQVGLEGSTGDSTGPHLHFEVRLDGAPTDPIPYLPAA